MVRDPTRLGQRWPARWAGTRYLSRGECSHGKAKSIMDGQDGTGVALAIHLRRIFPITVVAGEAQINSKPMSSPVGALAFTSRYIRLLQWTWACTAGKTPGLLHLAWELRMRPLG